MGFIDFCFQRETAYCMFDFLPVICSRQYVILGGDKTFERKLVDIFISTNINICFGCSKEPSQ